MVRMILHRAELGVRPNIQASSRVNGRLTDMSGLSDESVAMPREDGPASRVGVRWSDRIIAVGGEDPADKSVAELESLLSCPKPATTMTLTIERAGVRNTFSLELAQAAPALGTRDVSTLFCIDRILPAVTRFYVVVCERPPR
jgi:C-terminal processing protease CtpA/Prc